MAPAKAFLCTFLLIFVILHMAKYITGKDITTLKGIYIAIFLLISFSTLAQKHNLQRYEYSQKHMGTLFRIVLHTSDSVKANIAGKAGFKRVAQLNQILSDYEKDSELNQLCRTAGSGQWFKVSSDLWYILKQSVKISEKTNGAFDITLGPYVQLWRRARRQGELPTPTALAEAKKAIGYQYILFNKKDRSVQLTKPNMQLDLGAIGKGYAVDEALKVLKQHGIKRALIDGGGNIVVGKNPPQANGWEIDLEPAGPSNIPQKIRLHKNAIATSGDLYQYIELNGIHYSHILDPATGIGLTDQSRVIIIAKNGITTDWLSTSVSVLGPEKGIKLVKNIPGAAVLFVRNINGQLQKWSYLFESRTFTD